MFRASLVVLVCLWLSNLCVASVSDVVVLDVVPHDINVNDLGAPVFPRNTMVPCKRSLIFSTDHDDQDSIFIRVYEDASPMAVYRIYHLYERQRGRAQISVTFSVDFSGILTVSDEDMACNSNRVEIEQVKE